VIKERYLNTFDNTVDNTFAQKYVSDHTLLLNSRKSPESMKNQTPNPQSPQLPVEIASKAKIFLQNELAKNTHKAYRTDLKQYKNYCDELQIPYTSETAVLSYLTEIADKFKVATIQRKIAALRKLFHERQIQPNPAQTENVKKLLKGIVNTKGVKPSMAKALELDKLQQLENMDTHSPNASPITLRDKALLLVGFCGAFRVSELVGLRQSDVEFTKQGATLYLRKSKTDQSGEGQYKALVFGRNQDLCPVRALEQWLKYSVQYSAENLLQDEVENQADDVIFYSFNHKLQINRIQQGQEKGKPKPLSPQAVSKKMKKYFGKDYSPHSLRAGFVTTAIENGASTEAVMNQTGHKNAKMVRRYTRHTDIYTNNAVTNLPL